MFTAQQTRVIEDIEADGFEVVGKPFLTMDEFARIDTVVLGMIESVWIAPDGTTYNDNPFPAA